MTISQVGMLQCFRVLKRKVGKNKWIFFLLEFEDGGESGKAKWMRVDGLDAIPYRARGVKRVDYSYYIRDLRNRGFDPAADRIVEIMNPKAKPTNYFQDFEFLLPDQINA